MVVVGAPRRLAAMGDEGTSRKRRFHPPVVAPYLGEPAGLPALYDRLTSLPSAPLGSPATVTWAGSASRPADPKWSARVQANGGRRVILRGIPRAPAHAGAGATRARARSDKRPRPLPYGPAQGANDEDGGWGGVDDPLSSARAALRRASSRRAPAPAVDTRMMEALSACVRRACGLPSSTPIGRCASTVSTVMVADPASRSRAILVHVCSGKADAAILWCSFRGGILCSCFAGTQNALFISASSRSSVCKHATALQSSLSSNGISLDTFWRRMHLGPLPANFVCRQSYGPMRFWVVLYRSVYSLVSFTAANVATCIAPSCRRFRARCGHVVLARPLNTERRAMDASDAAKDPCAKVGKVKPDAAVDGGPVPQEPADEDVGIESEPGDTDRASSDAAEAVAVAWQRLDVPQCGYCQPGMIMASAALLNTTPKPTDKDIDQSITNICRCGTFRRVRKGIHRAAELGYEVGA